MSWPIWIPGLKNCSQSVCDKIDLWLGCHQNQMFTFSQRLQTKHVDELIQEIAFKLAENLTFSPLHLNMIMHIRFA